MKYWQPFGVTDPNAAYQNGDLAAGIDGSIPPAGAIEATQREIVAVIQASGLTPSATDNTQLLKVFGILTPKIAVSPVLYVRTDGNDNNDGSSNDSAHAFATISGAITKGTRSFFLVGTVLTVQLGIAGTYAFPGNIPAGGGSILVKGDVTNQGNYILSGSGPAGGGSALLAASGSQVAVQGVTIQNTGTVNHTVGAVGGGSLNLQNVTFANTVTSPFAHILATGGGSVTISTGCIHQGFAAYAWLANGGSITMAANVTMSGTPAFSGRTVLATANGNIFANAGFTFSGSATGQRYEAALNGTIQTNGAGANFFPGSTAGASNSGGQYA